jgi:UDP-GlcNAc:undecaprenyl-phosphate GlcNAc-1-phosphate transferase
MLKYLVLLLTSFCLSLVLTPLVRLLALRIGAVDRPGARKIQTKPIPRLGGVGVAMAAGLTVLLAHALEGVDDLFIPVDLAAWTPMLLGGLIVFVGGVWDDIRPLSAGMKFLFQGVAAAIAIGLGVRIEELFFFGTGIWDLGVLAIPLTFLWIVGITNAFNLVDGLDGLAAGLASIAAGTCAAIFLLRGDAQDAMLLVILVGALAGFLRYNFNPARIFLGDSGSLVVGYVLAVTAITGSQKGATAMAVIVPLLVFGLPILDTLLSMARRFVGGLKMIEPYKAPLKQRVLAAKRMFEADQGHIHHRLIALGFSHRNAVLAMYAIALGLSLMALISVLAQFRNAGIILIAVGLATYIGIRKLGYEEIVFLRNGTLLRWYEQLAFNRLFFLGFVDLILITSAYWLSFVLKYEFHWSPEVKIWYLGAFPIVLLIQLGVFTVFGLYRGVWRATGIGDLLRVLFAVVTGVALSYTVVLLSVPPSGVGPFFCINLLVLAALTGGARCTYRVLDYTNQRENSAGSGALIYGAGRGGQLVLRELLQNAELGLRPIGFLDDDPSLRQRTVNRVPVLGSSSDLSLILESRPVASVVIASDKISGDRLQNVLCLCEERHIPVLHAQLKLEPIATNGNGGNGQRT